MRNSDEVIDIIISLCKKKGISQNELARRTGFAKSAISRYFNRTREFPINKLGLFAEALDVTPEYILFEEKEVSTKSITFRTSPEINDRLNIISEISGIPKAGLILYAVNEYLRLGKELDIKHTEYISSVRTSIRISDDINSLLVNSANRLNLNKNGIMNFIVSYYIDNVWSYYE